mgnify:CR=1 FL=1
MKNSDPNRNMSSHRVTSGDRQSPAYSARLPLVVVLDRLRSAFNVGNIFRLSEATRVRRLITCGYTASPPHPKLAKTARGCEQLVPHQHNARAEEAVAQLKTEGFTVYGVETISGAQAPWNTEFSFPVALVLGNEALGMSREALAQCDKFLALPQLGRKNSINVGNCAAVILYEVARQYLSRHRASV